MNQEFADDFLRETVRLLEVDFLPRLRSCVESLSEQELWWRPNQNCNSVGNLLLHLEGNVRQWVIAGVGGAPDERQRDREFSSREGQSAGQLLSQLEETLSEACATILSLPPARLLETTRIQIYEVSLMQAILHVVEHFSHHLGQIIYLTKSVRDVDLGFYARLGSDSSRFEE